MDVLRTDRTYASRENAIKHLKKVCASTGIAFESIRWCVATNEEGRFAPVVMAASAGDFPSEFPRNGVTIA